MKQWKELIREDVFRLGGHQDHLPACLAHMLYYVVAEEQYNLAYFVVKRIECTRATLTANLPQKPLAQQTNSTDSEVIVQGTSFHLFFILSSSRHFEHEHVVMNPTSAGMRHHHLHLYIQRISLTGFPTQSVGSSNTDVLDLPCLLVLITGMSQSRQHVDTSLIHIESRKSPTAVLFDDDTRRISIRHCEY
ncbi:hypothetical protein Tco_0245358 [Tanacetum coccineum]